MLPPHIVTYGSTPVPWTVSWALEYAFSIGLCPYSKRDAIFQNVMPGYGKPAFGKPHSNRQRECIALGLCDLCGRPLASRTKVSLSHARPVPHSAGGFEILQVEPLLHKECAALSMKHCPSLLRDIQAGTLMVRQVFASRCQFAVMSAEYVETITGTRQTAIGHAKVQLVKWKDRDMGWLG